MRTIVLLIFPYYQTNVNNFTSCCCRVDFLINGQVPASKLVLGIPVYGKTWTTTNGGGSKVPPVPASGAGNAGPMTQEAGVLSYTEICLNVKNNGWTEVDDASGPYAYNSNQWAGYDTVRSAKEKAQYVLDKGLGGAMIWELSFDDFKVSAY